MILGCTHFPLLGDAIAEYLGEDVQLISCGGEAALALREYLHREEKLNTDNEMGSRRWFTSGDAELFSAGAGVFLGHSVEAEKADF